jgi:hypothetical protein
MARQEVELTIKPVLDAVTVRPGDRLIVRVRPDITREQADELAGQLQERLPGLDVIILAAEQIVVYWPTTEPLVRPRADESIPDA